MLVAPPSSTPTHTCPMNINNVFLLTHADPFFLSPNFGSINKDIVGFLVRRRAKDENEINFSDRKLIENFILVFLSEDVMSCVSHRSLFLQLSVQSIPARFVLSHTSDKLDSLIFRCVERKTSHPNHPRSALYDFTLFSSPGSNSLAVN